jgi:hypothetical protein
MEPRRSTPVARKILIPTILILCPYGLAYLLSTEVFYGKMDTTRYRIRLFQTEWHLRVFRPMIAAEKWVRPREPEFSAQISNHASLPPAE